MENNNEKWVTEILITKEEISARIKELAQWVNETYKDSKELVLIGLLKGSLPFLLELIKDITVIHSMDFMIASSYAGQQESSNTIKIVTDLSIDIAGKDALIVEDIVDSGITLKKITEILKQKNPKSLKVLTLLDKPEGRKDDFTVDKTGFVVPNKFLVGFGLDVKEKLRNIPFIGVFDKTKFDEL